MHHSPFHALLHRASRVVQRWLAAPAAALVLLFAHAPAQAQVEPVIGQVMCGIYNFAPKGWALMDGSTLSIASNTALFSLLGVMYGGDGRTTFKLPDMRGRIMLSSGQGPGLTPRAPGEVGGGESTTLTLAQMPAHNHSVTHAGSSAVAATASPAGALLPTTSSRSPRYTTASANTAMAPITSAITGASQPVQTLPPFGTVNCYIATQGIYPVRP